jgi:RHS repeat-associated protein
MTAFFAGDSTNPATSPSVVGTTYDLMDRVTVTTSSGPHSSSAADQGDLITTTTYDTLFAPTSVQRLTTGSSSRARVYDPISGRFTQEDPAGLAGGLNAYGFVGGDPVNYSDPFGLCGEESAKGAQGNRTQSNVNCSQPLARDANGMTGDMRTEVANGDATDPGLINPLMFMGGLDEDANVVLTGLGKTEARAAVDALGIDAAQAAGAKKAIARATTSSTIDTIQDEENTLTVNVIRPGRDGYQVMENTIKPDGTKSVVQKAYDAKGNLVHYDPKNP